MERLCFHFYSQLFTTLHNLSSFTVQFNKYSPIPCSIVIGYDEGSIMVKIGREIPVASMDNSGKIIWAKHNEIQTADIRRVGAGYEVWS